MITASLKPNVTPFHNSKRLINKIDRVVDGYLRQVQVETKQRFLPQLQRYAPPRTNTKFVWSKRREANARARRWWFANINNGTIRTDGQHYVRSGRMRESFFIDKRDDSIVIGTTFNRIRYVQGDAQGRGQIPGHRQTGWQKQAPIAKQARDFAQKQFVDRYNDGLQDLSDLEFVR